MRLRVFPANQLEKMLRDMHSHKQMIEELIKQRTFEQVGLKRFQGITKSNARRSGQAGAQSFRHRRQFSRGQ
jgi:hypothetical protein